MHTRMLLGVTALAAAMVSGIPSSHAEDVINELQRALGNGSDRSRSAYQEDRSRSAYQEGREDEHRREQAQRERRREMRQRPLEQPYGSQPYGSDERYYTRQQRGS